MEWIKMKDIVQITDKSVEQLEKEIMQEKEKSEKLKDWILE